MVLQMCSQGLCFILGRPGRLQQCKLGIVLEDLCVLRLCLLYIKCFPIPHFLGDRLLFPRPWALRGTQQNLEEKMREGLMSRRCAMTGTAPRAQNPCNFDEVPHGTPSG